MLLTTTESARPWQKRLKNRANEIKEWKYLPKYMITSRLFSNVYENAYMNWQNGECFMYANLFFPGLLCSFHCGQLMKLNNEWKICQYGYKLN